MKLDRDLSQEVAYRLQYPKLGALAVNILYHKMRKKLGIEDGVDIIEEDWDNLIILDACRYDAFAQVIADFPTIQGNLNSRRSKAAYTRQFLRRSFHGRTLHDTVYITSSPQLYDLGNLDGNTIETNFHAVIHSFLDSEFFDRQEQNWDESRPKNTTDGYRPEHTTEIASRVNQDFPKKRLIVHYLPPHLPFLGEKGQRIFSDIDDDAPWEELTAGRTQIAKDELWNAYLENLRIGLENVAELLPELQGKTVITADHGQLLGDSQHPIPISGYGHPGIYIDELVKVPWFICEHESRKEIIPEAPVGQPYKTVDSKVAERKVKERLKDLGYGPS